MKLCLQILIYGVMLGHLVSADRTPGCQRVPVNNDRVQGECCVFVKERPKDLQQELLGLLDPKLNSQMFLQHEAHSAEDVEKAIIGLMPLYKKEGQRPLDKPPILIIGNHHKNHQASPRGRESHRSHEHVHTQDNSKKSGSAPLKNFTKIGQVPQPSNNGGEMFNVTKEIKSTIEDNTTGNITIGKTVLDNRNAIDVPIVECPTGQAKDSSGSCVLEFV